MNPLKAFLRLQALAALFMALICLTEANGSTGMVGGDLDCNGCKASAGYTWCEALKICIRPFETECPLFSSVNTTSSGSSFNSQAVKVKATLKKKAPKLAKALKAPKVSEAPKSSKAPKLVKASKAPKVTKAPKKTKVTKAPKKTKGTKAAEVPDSDSLGDTPPGYVTSNGSTAGSTSTRTSASSYGTYSKTVTVTVNGSSGLTVNTAPSALVSVDVVTQKTKAKVSKALKTSKAPKESKAPKTSKAPKVSKAPKTSKAPKVSKAPKTSKAPKASQINSLGDTSPRYVTSSGSIAGSTSTTTTTTTTTSKSSSTWSQSVQVVGSSGQCIDAVLKLVDCDTKEAETIFTSSASTCSTTFDFSNKQQFCLTLNVGSFVYNAGPIYSVNTAATSTSSTITIKVTSTQVFLQYGTSSKTIMTSTSSGLFYGASGSAPLPVVVSPPISAPIPITVAPPMTAPIPTTVAPPMAAPTPIAVAPPVTSAPAPGEKKVDLISNDRGN